MFLKRCARKKNGKPHTYWQLVDTVDTHDNDPVPQYVEVDLKGVRIERTQDFGDVFLALTLWRMLGFDELFSKNLPVGREEVSWSLMACVLTIARFVEPDSELHVEDTWYHRTALGQMPAVAAGKVNSARLYRTLDTIMPSLKDKLKYIPTRSTSPKSNWPKLRNESGLEDLPRPN